MNPRPAEPPRPLAPELSGTDRRELSKLAWRSLIEACPKDASDREGSGKPVFVAEELSDLLSEGLSPALKRSRGVFVTLWTRREGQDSRLRGCIGAPRATEPLASAVANHVRGAAFSDPRFAPLTPGELDELEIEISVLGALVPLAGAPREWSGQIEIGEDGLWVFESCRGAGGRRGLLLPKVASRWGFDATQFLEEVCEKAGLERDAWKSGGVEVHRFRVLSFTAERSE